MSRRDLVLVTALLLGGAAAVIGVAILVTNLCPGPTPTDPCPDADRNRLLVIATAAAAVTAFMTAGAFVLDFATHKRIVYLGSWPRALRRGLLAGLSLAAIAGLRLLDALNLFSAAVVVVVAMAAEWLAVRRLDGT